MYCKSFLFFLCILLFSCSKDKEIEDSSDFILNNNPLPSKNHLLDGNLKMLFIGSSWMKNTFSLTNKVFFESGIKVTIGGLYYGGVDFKNLVSFAKENRNMEYYYSKNGADWFIIEQNIHNVLKSEDWDIIVIQQSANFSFSANSYQPYLNQFRDFLVSNSKNEKVCLVLNQTWTPAKNSSYIKSFGFNNQLDMYISSFSACKKAMTDSGIDIVIPSGQAVYLLRNSVLENDLDLTIDQLHLDSGAGEYLTACTVFMSLIYPILGISLEENTFRTNQGLVPVTDLSAPIIQDCAIRAYKDPFALIN